MQQTPNYSLNKPAQTDIVNIEDLNSNFDTLDTELKKVSDKANLIQTAGGTGTAITLNNVNLVNGFTITFVVAANNNGAATSINGKALYKPGGTSAPVLTAGKAVAVWYNGTNFFIKASAEGNAAAGDVLAGKTFSSDADTGITGSMPNRGAVSQSLPINGTYAIPAGYHNGSGRITQSIATKAATTITPGTSDQVIASGQYLGGNQTIKGDANLLPSNIKSGVSMFGVIGNLASANNFIKTYLTVSSANPIYFKSEFGDTLIYYITVNGLTGQPSKVIAVPVITVEGAPGATVYIPNTLSPGQYTITSSWWGPPNNATYHPLVRFYDNTSATYPSTPAWVTSSSLQLPVYNYNVQYAVTVIYGDNY